MKKGFVITTLTLCLLLAAAPAQVFAGTGHAGTNGSSDGNNNAHSRVIRMNGDSFSNCFGAGGSGSLADLFKQYLQQSSGGSQNGTAGCEGQNCNKNNASNCKGQSCDKNNNGSCIGSNCPNGNENSSQNAGTNKPNTNPDNNTNSNSNNNSNGNTNNNTSNNTNNSGSVGKYEQQVADIVNQERAAAGLSPLKVNTKLSAVAEKKAEDMRDQGYFSHTSPTYGSPFDMMKQFGISYMAAGENIAKGQKTPQSVMNAWMNSSGHKANILSTKYDQIGVGYVTDANGTTYWVQMFMK